MAQEFAKKFYHSSAWLRVRAAYLKTLINTSGDVVVRKLDDDGSITYVRESDGAWVPSSTVVPPGMCERCFILGESTAADTVHHIRHLTPQNIDDVNVTLSFDNLQRLCRDCHKVVHSGSAGPRYRFGPDGQIAPIDGEREFREQVLALTETESERRNVHSRRDHR